MRAGVCSTVHQTLTPEAATIVKQAVQLARRRGHAQVTPLHVATAMLSSSTGLFRAGCLHSHSHPLQCKALELCFNVALNRLPASSAATTGPTLLGGHHYPHYHHSPSLNNALVAAFKRAQAYQRRGSVDNQQQQQPLLAVKIELEQLVLSILDDPSVSRVMREAGFSSTQVKSNVEQAISISSSSSTSSSDIMYCGTTPSSSPRKAKEAADFFAPTSGEVKNEDLACVIEALNRRRKRSLVIVGECSATMEAVVRGVMDKVDKEEVPNGLRNVNFISLSLSSFMNMSREEVDEKIGEVKSFVKSSCIGSREAVLYLGNLNLAAEYRSNSEGREKSHSSTMDHILMEVGNLVFGGARGEDANVRLWLLSIATYQTFLRCKSGSPSIGSLWDLQPLTLPTGSLNLSLNSEFSQSSCEAAAGGLIGSARSSMEDRARSQLSFYADSSVDLQKPNTCCYSSRTSVSSTLPPWLRQYSDVQENSRASDAKEKGIQLADKCRKWNTICSSAYTNQRHPSELTFNFSSVSPTSSISSYDHSNASLHQNQEPWQLLTEPKLPWREHQFLKSEADKDESCQSKFKELNAENLKILCTELERRAKRPQEMISELASTILHCRSGMARRVMDRASSKTKEETWLFFQGCDSEGKERLARELANLIFGSYSKFVRIGLSAFRSTRSCSSTDDTGRKRSREEASHSCLERLFDAVRQNPHQVFLMEDIERADARTRAGIRSAIERGKIESYDGGEVDVSDAIIILSCESFDCSSRACSPLAKLKAGSEEEAGSYSKASFDLNLGAEDQDLDDSISEDDKLLELVDRAFFFKIPHEDL